MVYSSFWSNLTMSTFFDPVYCKYKTLMKYDVLALLYKCTEAWSFSFSSIDPALCYPSISCPYVCMINRNPALVCNVWNLIWRLVSRVSSDKIRRNSISSSSRTRPWMWYFSEYLGSLLVSRFEGTIRSHYVVVSFHSLPLPLPDTRTIEPCLFFLRMEQCNIQSMRWSSFRADASS